MGRGISYNIGERNRTPKLGIDGTMVTINKAEDRGGWGFPRISDRELARK